MEGKEGVAQKEVKGKKSYKGKYAALVNKLVVCRWIDITSYDLNGLDEFLICTQILCFYYLRKVLGRR